MKTTKIFFDTEFTGLQQDTSLISIGFVSDCGKTFYAELTDYKQDQVDDWIKTNVIDNLVLEKDNEIYQKGNLEEQTVISYKDSDNITYKGVSDSLDSALENWFKQFDKVEMWSGCLAYDWVLFCQIFGHAFNIPKNIYYIPFDICTLFHVKGMDPDTSISEFSELKGAIEHNALFDALAVEEAYNKLTIK